LDKLHKVQFTKIVLILIYSKSAETALFWEMGKIFVKFDATFHNWSIGQSIALIIFRVLTGNL